METVENKEFIGGNMDERTNERTKITDRAHADTSKGDFAKAMMMIAELPLDDAEKAEAVRRLLTQAGGGDAGDQGGER